MNRDQFEEFLRKEFRSMRRVIIAALFPNPEIKRDPTRLESFYSSNSPYASPRSTKH